jgi:hypothetical protein
VVREHQAKFEKVICDIEKSMKSESVTDPGSVSCNHFPLPSNPDWMPSCDRTFF